MLNSHKWPSVKKNIFIITLVIAVGFLFQNCGKGFKDSIGQKTQYAIDEATFKVSLDKTTATADGSDKIIIEIQTLGTDGNGKADIRPEVSITNTDNQNIFAGCSPSDSSGVSTCEVRSRRAEAKIITVVSPVLRVLAPVHFVAGPPVLANSDIEVAGTFIADGEAQTQVGIHYRDANENPVAGVTPELNLVNSGLTLVSCTGSNATGYALCILTSTQSGNVNLQLKVGGEVFAQEVPYQHEAANLSVLSIAPEFTAPAVLKLRADLKKANGTPLANQMIQVVFKNIENESITANASCVSNAGGTAMCAMSSEFTLAGAYKVEVVSPFTASILTTVVAAAATKYEALSIGRGIAGTTSSFSYKVSDAYGNWIKDYSPAVTSQYSNSTQVAPSVACMKSDAQGFVNCEYAPLKSAIYILRDAKVKLETSFIVDAGPLEPTKSTVTGAGATFYANGTSTAKIQIDLYDNYGNPVSPTNQNISVTAQGPNSSAVKVACEIPVACLSLDCQPVHSLICLVSSTAAGAITLNIGSPLNQTVNLTARSAAPHGGKVSTTPLLIEDRLPHVTTLSGSSFIFESEMTYPSGGGALVSLSSRKMGGSRKTLYSYNPRYDSGGTYPSTSDHNFGSVVGAAALSDGGYLVYGSGNSNGRDEEEHPDWTFLKTFSIGNCPIYKKILINYGSGGNHFVEWRHCGRGLGFIKEYRDNKIDHIKFTQDPPVMGSNGKPATTSLRKVINTSWNKIYFAVLRFTAGDAIKTGFGNGGGTNALTHQRFEYGRYIEGVTELIGGRIALWGSTGTGPRWLAIDTSNGQKTTIGGSHYTVLPSAITYVFAVAEVGTKLAILARDSSSRLRVYEMSSVGVFTDVTPPGNLSMFGEAYFMQADASKIYLVLSSQCKIFEYVLVNGQLSANVRAQTTLFPVANYSQCHVDKKGNMFAITKTGFKMHLYDLNGQRDPYFSSASGESNLIHDFGASLSGYGGSHRSGFDLYIFMVDVSNKHRRLLYRAD